MKSARLVSRLLLASTAIVMALASCGDSGPASWVEVPESSRQDVMASLTGLVIVPRYRQAAESMGELSDSVAALCSSLGAGALETARSNWRKAREAWMTTEAFRFGPAMDRRSVSLVDWWPVDIDGIDRTLDEGNPVTEETVLQFLPSTHRGMSAMEHLIFGAGSEALAAPVASPESKVRCRYLESLAAVTHEEVAGILGDLEGEGESAGYAGYIDGSAKLSLHPRDGEAEVVRSLVFLVRTISNMRLGAALGVDSEPDPAAIPAGAAGHSTKDLERQLLSISEAYRGASGMPDALGIGHIVAQLSPEVDGRMAAAIENTAEAIENVEGSLESAIANNPQSVRNVYDSFKELQRVLNTEVVSLLGVSVGFSDTDGDS